MSLDVTLTGKSEEHTCWTCNGKGVVIESEKYFSSNITHNLGDMAKETGIYMHLWHPKEIGIAKANIAEDTVDWHAAKIANKVLNTNKGK